ncbi:MAG: T9SS type A sorting domain-containing protein [Bacteroidia bacterium]|nr:T9SS type A sorting domain-containing protein [Bacteroidia bacterium]
MEWYKRYCTEIAIHQAETGDVTLSEDQVNQLGEIAWTNVWEGGGGVFTARHLLEEQVFDLENNLRIRHPVAHSGSIPFAVSLYPNPASDAVTVFSSVALPEHLQVTVTDMRGKVLITQRLQSNILDVQSLPSGVYTFSFEYPGGVTRIREVIIR